MSTEGGVTKVVLATEPSTFPGGVVYQNVITIIASKQEDSAQVITQVTYVHPDGRSHKGRASKSLMSKDEARSYYKKCVNQWNHKVGLPLIG